MQQQRLLPAPPLRQHIRCYEFLTGEEQAMAIPPQLSSGIAFLWGKAKVMQAGDETILPSRYIIPVNKKSFGSASLSENTAIGVQFYPGKFQAFFHWPQHLFVDNTVNLDDTPLGKDCALLHEALDERASPEAQAAILDEYLLQRIPPNGDQLALAERVLRSIYQSPDFNKLRIELKSLRVSPRHLRRTFKVATGLNIQRFIRIYRFYQAYHRLLSRPVESFTNLAYDCGYFDQAHLDHDFKFFTSLSPSAFQRHHAKLVEVLAWQDPRHQHSSP